jgi:hypothetical protein
VSNLDLLNPRENPMKKLIALAALAFAFGTVHQAAACDFGAHAANATSVVVATTEQPTTQQPAAKPEAAAPARIATDKPVAPPVHYPRLLRSLRPLSCSFTRSAAAAPAAWRSSPPCGGPRPQ